MPYELREGQGNLFPNNRKEKDTHADWRGRALINGIEHYLDLWVKNGAKGEFFSMSFKPVGDAKSAAPASAPTPARSFAVAPQGAAVGPGTAFDDMGDEIPF